MRRIEIQLFKRKKVRIMLFFLSAFLAFILILLCTLLTCSPGKLEPFYDKDGKEIKGSISEKAFVTINGVKQGMFIKGKNKKSPVILFLHGGPGMPEYFLAEKYLTYLEDNFTVCYWEQRGSGLSYNPNASSDTLTVEQLVSDTLEVSNYLRKRFGQDKIYLMAHSWGTFLGIQAVERAPQLYNAYIGIGQVSQQLKSEKIAYEYMLEQYNTAGNKRMVQKLEAYPVFKSDTALNSYLSSSLRDEAMHNLGIGTMHNMKSVFNGVFLPVMQCRAYTLGEKINLWRGKAFLNKATNLRNQMYLTDLTAKVTKLDIPVYFFSGKYDYTVSRTLAKSYLDKLKAPIKGFYTFKQSAHSPMFEEPEEFICIMKTDVLNCKTSLADGI